MLQVCDDRDADYFIDKGRKDTYSHTIGWHIERLKAKIRIGQALGCPVTLQDAFDQAIELRLKPKELGFTSDEFDQLLAEALERDATVLSEVGSLTPIGKIVKKRAIAS